MDTSLFDNIYTLWSEKVPQIMRNTIKNDFFLKNDVFLRWFNEKTIVKYWVDLILTDSTKYDILAWLKAKANTSPINGGPIDFTEKGIKEIYHINDKRFYTAFRDGKKRHGDYYKDDLFKYDLPPFFLCVYSTNFNSCYNLFNRHDSVLEPESYFDLRNKLENTANIYINMISDEEIKKCQKITMEYYLENTYGFQLKRMMASGLSYIPIDNFIYQPDYRDTLFKKVLADFFEKEEINFTLPHMYKNLDAGSFKKMITFCSSSEFAFLKKSGISFGEWNEVLNSKDKPDPGYILMVMIFAKEVLLTHIHNINKCINNSYVYVKDDFHKSLDASKEIALKTQCLIDIMIKKFSFSLPGEKELTHDEILLLTDIKKKVKTKIEAANEAFSREPEFKKILHANVLDTETGQQFDIQNLSFSDDEDPITIPMPGENEIVLRFSKHIHSTLCKSHKYHFLHSPAKKIMKKSFKPAHFSKSKLNISYYNNPMKLAGTEIRSFKNLVIKLINNCFNVSTIAEYSPNAQYNYIVRPLPTQSKTMDNQFEMLKSRYNVMNNKKHILVSLRNARFFTESQYIHFELELFWREAISSCLENLYHDLITSFENPSEYKNYISRIYNTEVLNHVNKNWCYKEDYIDYQRIGTKILKKIIELP